MKLSFKFTDHPWVLINGKVIIGVMMKTIIQDVNMMEEIVVGMMSEKTIALFVNVWILANNNFIISLVMVSPIFFR